MVAATKKKRMRGRPPAVPGTVYEVCPEKSRRAAQNYYYAFKGLSVVDEETKRFFLMEDGTFKRQGIAEKIGRMLASGKVSEQEAASLAMESVSLYQAGKASKDIERALSMMARRAGANDSN